MSDLDDLRRVQHATAADGATAAALVRSFLASSELSAAPGRVDYEQWSLMEDDIAVARVSSRGARMRLALENADGVLCTFIVQGGVRLVRGEQSADLDAGSCALVAVEDGAVLEWQCARFVLVGLPTGAVRRLIASDTVARPLQASRLTPASPALGALWMRLAGLTMNLVTADGLGDRSLLRASLLDALVAATIEAFEVTEQVVIDQTLDGGIIDRAGEYMSTRLGDPLCVDDIALALGLSGRTLQLVYRQQAEEGPLGHLRRLRMAAAQHAFATATSATSVPAVAHGLGYRNVGRFGAHYRAANGESPSSALRRRAP